MQEIKKICIECGKEFIRKWNNQKICSDECRIKRNAALDAKCRKERIERKRAKENPSRCLREAVREAMSARDEYGRPMSYGKYVAIKEGM